MTSNTLLNSFAVTALSAIASTWLLTSQTAQAVCQDGCFTNNNTILGEDALLNNTGFDNTAIGFFALRSNATGALNTAIGFYALASDASGSNNTATGFNALASNTGGTYNTANGSQALYFNTTGNDDTATGYLALYSNTTGYQNTATGVSALQYNTTGSQNTAHGHSSLALNTTGNNNTATGVQALTSNMTGTQNTANGVAALQGNTTGNDNTANGWQALLNNNGSNNIAIGSSAGSYLTTGSNNIAIGHLGVAGESNTIHIGTKSAQTKTLIAGIYGATTSGGIAVYVNAAGKLGTTTSSARFKEDIRDMANQSDVLLSLRPVSFRYKPEVDPQPIPQFGLVAEEVEKIDPDLVVRDSDGKPYTVRYDAVNAMLLNEFLKAHRKIEEQDRQLQKQQKQIEALTAGLQKVNDKLELSKSAPQLVDR